VYCHLNYAAVMSSRDPGEERTRLAARYAVKTDDELRRLADQAYTLTEPAMAALEAEIIRRALPLELRDAPVIEKLPANLVTIRIFRDLPDALLAKTILDSADIECFLYDENIIRLDWLWSNLVGGIKLRVRTDDAGPALELLGVGVPEQFAVDGFGDYKQPRCPQCGSLDLSFGENGKRLGYLTVALGVPLPVKRGGWKCHSCGCSWHDSEDPPEERSVEPGM
jgi:hypothetical protein